MDQDPNNVPTQRKMKIAIHSTLDLRVTEMGISKKKKKKTLDEESLFLENPSKVGCKLIVAGILFKMPRRIA